MAAAATESTASVAEAVRDYRDPARVRCLKLADGGLTDNQGLSSILVARALSGTPHGPLTEADAVRVRRMLFLIVDAGRDVARLPKPPNVTTPSSTSLTFPFRWKRSRLPAGR